MPFSRFATTVVACTRKPSGLVYLFLLTVRISQSLTSHFAHFERKVCQTAVSEVGWFTENTVCCMGLAQTFHFHCRDGVVFFSRNIRVPIEARPTFSSQAAPFSFPRNGVRSHHGFPRVFNVTRNLNTTYVPADLCGGRADNFRGNWNNFFLEFRK
uniref:(northern house mosquito) hypothetical protein n=1 Tax=Culex pipiens TaxID=7175 RepID=A0A8D8JK27_CULPI